MNLQHIWRIAPFDWLLDEAKRADFLNPKPGYLPITASDIKIVELFISSYVYCLLAKQRHYNHLIYFLEHPVYHKLGGGFGESFIGLTFVYFNSLLKI